MHTESELEMWTAWPVYLNAGCSHTVQWPKLVSGLKQDHVAHARLINASYEYPALATNLISVRPHILQLQGMSMAFLHIAVPFAFVQSCKYCILCGPYDICMCH